ncbi:unnamed protein product [Phytophthora fragariaefolia]|uniref:Unnamed protein product n=1 Tax=Phytophthora fragariaefolia TaxID=1490495 RepID=A0A9W6YKA3_9STRA|nr:unnamed protein product [Phytophthora fragariaefolia]
MDIACQHCHVGSVRVSERDINGYTGVRVPEELKALRTSLIAQMASSTGGGRSAPSRTVSGYSSRPSFTPFGGFCGGGLRTPSPFPERPASGRSAAPTEFPPVRLTVVAEAAGRRRGSGPPDLVDRLEAVERLQIAGFAALKQELALLKAQLAQVAQTASNVQVDVGSSLNVF